MRNEAAKPEEHSKAFEGEDCERARDFREKARRNREEGNDDEYRPDANEDQKVDPGGRAIEIVSVKPRGHYQKKIASA